MLGMGLTTLLSLTQTAGADIAVVSNLGGSLPNDVSYEVLGLTTIWTPNYYAGCLQHAPNEHILKTVFKCALKLMTGLWWIRGADKKYL